MAMTRAQKNRSIRQEALREELSNKGLLQKVLEDIEKLGRLDDELDPTKVNRIKIGIDSRLKLISKYLPDLKATEITGEAGSDLNLITKIERHIVKPESGSR